jgi:hypothetical protein
MTKLIITNKFDAKKILTAEISTRKARPLGMMELFTELAQKGCCESYSASRIYYLAYLLAENYPGLQFEIVKDGQ